MFIFFSIDTIIFMNLTRFGKVGSTHFSSIDRSFYIDFRLVCGNVCSIRYSSDVFCSMWFLSAFHLWNVIHGFKTKRFLCHVTSSRFDHDIDFCFLCDTVSNRRDASLLHLVFVFFSYHKVGLLVLFVHDITDIWLELAKVFHYLSMRQGRELRYWETAANGGFVIFILCWCVSLLSMEIRSKIEEKCFHWI